ncbi:hypothetical protein [Novosphingobium sp. 9U]|uniref:hypothetical protein n=1 Tax=Novosphingobium sp. 9U TaxID=2653158 RepID=UPI0012F24241|nr:hypothetical protein [Novosphingobium sp. 9U]VWX52961.1 hypothetical protein NOVOSPHI9U_420204 [Novosphingobium sp. 9U]
MILGSSGAFTRGTDGVATASLPESWGGYLAAQIARGEVPIDRQVQPNTPLPRAPAGYVSASGWQAWVTGRRRALGGRG